MRLALLLPDAMPNTENLDNALFKVNCGKAIRFKSLK
jgi:hypothetical protein